MSNCATRSSTCTAPRAPDADGSFARLNAVRAQDDQAFIRFQNEVFDTYTGAKSAHSFIRTEDEAIALRPEAFSYRHFSEPKTLPEYLRLVQEVRRDPEFAHFNYDVGQKMYSGAFWRRLRYLTGVVWGERWSDLPDETLRLCGIAASEPPAALEPQPEPEPASEVDPPAEPAPAPTPDPIPAPVVEPEEAVLPAQRRFFEKLLAIGTLSPSTVSHYRRSMDVLDAFVRDRSGYFGLASVYGAGSREQLKELWVRILTDDDFNVLNAKNHNMCSAALQKFVEFVEEGWVEVLPDAAEPVDPYLPASDRPGDLIIDQALRCADWRCAHNPEHATFMTEEGHNYVEAHHLIPLSLQPRFGVNLHVWANVVAFCPNCHALMHHGTVDDRRVLFADLYAKRAERLRTVGIRQTCDELMEIVFG